MAPRSDDLGIPPGTQLVRRLYDNWTCASSHGGERPTSESLTDSNLENSLYIVGAGESSVEELQAIYPGAKFAVFTAGLFRANKFAIERRPDEADPRVANPMAHVIAGPMDIAVGKVYERRARTIVTDPSVIVIVPIANQKKS